MSPDAIIKYFHYRHRAYWREVAGLTFEGFQRLCLASGYQITKVQYSRLTGAAKTPASLEQCINDDSTRRSIESALLCPGLFSCTSEMEIDELVARIVYANRESDEVAGELLEVELEPQFPIAPGEREFIARLRNRIKGTRRILVHWEDPPIGSTLLLHYLRVDQSADEYSNVFLALPHSEPLLRYLKARQPTVEASAYELAFSSLYHRLGIAGNPAPRNLLQRLESTDSLLVIIWPRQLPYPRRTPNRATELVEHLIRLPNPEGKARVLLAGSSPPRLAGKMRKISSPEFNESDRESLETRRFFLTQLRRYAEIRRPIPHAVETDDARIDRALRYFLSENGTAPASITLRILAFFSSNLADLSYLDPTAGWSRLCGVAPANLPADLLHVINDYVNEIEGIPRAKRTPSIRPMQWCATALYWLTDSAADRLAKLAPRISVNSYKKALSEVPRLVFREEVSGHAAYRMDLTTKALVQERWVKLNPLSRAQCHWEIALRLFENRDNAELLELELPLAPHWGRSKIHFLAECVRHLVRTSDRTTQRPVKKYPQEYQESFPDAPVADWNGCNPYQVINYCFGVLFWQLLNENRGTGNIHNRKLARQHGAYRLTAEILQLLSNNNNLGEPHWALNPRYVLRYLREVAYAQLDLGNLREARESFERMIRIADSRGENWRDCVNFRLDLAIATSALGEINAAMVAVREARELFESKNEGEKDAKRANQAIRNRLDARDANIYYLRGDFTASLAHLDSIFASSPRAMVRDVAHTHIAVLGALKDRDKLNQALQICLQNLFDNTSQQIHHEALGFRVALGHLFRRFNMLEAAEVTLDAVLRDLRLHGCSERTYLAMLLEAGRVLVAQKRYARAYAAYLCPCVIRSHLKGFKRSFDQSRRYALACIEALQAVTPSKDKVDFDLCGRGDFGAPSGSAVDPKYSFTFDLEADWSLRLSSVDALAEEHQRIAALHLLRA